MPEVACGPLQDASHSHLHLPRDNPTDESLLYSILRETLRLLP